MFQFLEYQLSRRERLFEYRRVCVNKPIGDSSTKESWPPNCKVVAHTVPVNRITVRPRVRVDLRRDMASRVHDTVEEVRRSTYVCTLVLFARPFKASSTCR